MSWTKLTIAVALLLAVGFLPTSCRRHELSIGSKSFTESVILGELIRVGAQSRGIDAVHYQQVGGTQIVYQGLLHDEIALYPEYTGTLVYEILGMEQYDEAEMRRRVAAEGLGLSQPLGFNNSYAIGMKRDRAEELQVATISDLKRYPDLVYRFGNEFMERPDGWQQLKKHYGLEPTDVRGMDHDVAYRELESGTADVMDVYTTDSKIKLYDVVVLQDDRQFFPPYECVILYRQDVWEKDSRVRETVEQLEGALTRDRMLRLNAEVELERRSEAEVAEEFMKEQLGVKLAQQSQDNVWHRLWVNTAGHLDLVRSSLAAAILFAIPLGVLAAKFPRVGLVVLPLVGIVQTMPGLALLVLLIAPSKALGLTSIGAGSAPALIALFLYSLLPMVRNTYSGMTNIPAEIGESAEALGLTPLNRLFRIDLPMASPSIMAGIKTAAVINVGFATLGALIGAPGYGQPILAGVRLADNSLILEGAIPAAILAVLVQLLFDGVERVVVPKGLTINRT